MVFLIAGSILFCLIILAFLSIKLLFRQSSTELQTLSNDSSLDMIKKYEWSKISNKRGILLLNGLLIALTFSIVLVEYKTEIIHQHVFEEKTVYVDDNEYVIPTQSKTTPPPPPPRKTPIIEEVDDIDLVVNDIIIDDIDDDFIDEPTDLPIEEIENDLADLDKDFDKIMDEWTVKTKPKFPGGISALHAYVVHNFKIPYRDQEKRGKIYIQFVIEKDGSVSGTKIIRGLSKLMDKEAQRIINSLPNWNPGINDGGAPVRVRYVFPISIQ